MNKRFAVMVVAWMAAVSVFAYKSDPEYVKARQSGADVRMVVSIVDDKGCAVSNANVRVLMGMNFREKAYFINGVTDTEGKFVIEGKTTGNEIEIDVEKEGYYRASKRMSRQDGRGIRSEGWSPVEPRRASLVSVKYDIFP